MCDHSLRKAVISANYHKAGQGCVQWHICYVIDRLCLRGSRAVFWQVDLSKNQTKTLGKHPKSPEHICWVLRRAFSVPWLDLSSYTFSVMIWKRGNASQEWDASPSTLRCNLDHLHETGGNSPVGVGQSKRENGPPLPAEGHVYDSHLVKCQSSSPAELPAIIQSHAEFTLWYRHTPLPHSSEAIQRDLEFRRLFVVLQEQFT